MLEELDRFVEEQSRLRDGAAFSGNTVASTGESVVATVEENLRIFYNKLEQMGYNLDELRPILETEGHIEILSGAGSGKTTAITLKLIHDMITGEVMKWYSGYNGGAYLMPQKILVSTFLRTGAIELKKSFTDWCYRLGITGYSSDNIIFRTLHSEFYDLLKSIPIQFQLADNTSTLLRESCNKFSIHAVGSTTWGGKSVTQEELRDIETIVGYYRNRISEKRFQHPLMAQYQLNTGLLPALVEDFTKKKNVAGVVDFEDLQELIYNALQDPNLRDFMTKTIGARYDFMYLDEFQDTSEIQYEILKVYFASCKKVVVIGDDDQTIYSWRGSDNSIITHRFEEDMKPAVCTLTVNYRCKSNILNAVVPSISCNVNRHPKQLRSAVEGGVLNVFANGSVDELLENIKNDIVAGMSVGVLSRTNQDLLIPAILLELDSKVDFTVSKSVGVRNKIPRLVFGIVDMIIKPYTNQFQDFFKALAGFKGRTEVDALLSLLQTNRPLTIFTISEQDLMYSAPGLYYRFLSQLRNYVASGELVQGYKFLLRSLKSTAFNGKSAFAERGREFVDMTLRLLDESSLLRNKGLDEIAELLNGVIPDQLDMRIQRGKDCKVKLTTIHEAKGKEWDSVYIWNDVDGVFPASVGNRELTPEEYEEERRVHYIAWTRAKSKLCVYTSRAKLSPFLVECDLSSANINEVSDTQLTKQRLLQKGNADTYKGLPVAFDSSEGGYKAIVNGVLDWLIGRLTVVSSDVSAPVYRVLQTIADDVYIRHIFVTACEDRMSGTYVLYRDKDILVGAKLEELIVVFTEAIQMTADQIALSESVDNDSLVSQVRAVFTD